jgi:Ni,Fe-hydrogenase I cytochrome b subunit
MCCTEFGCIYKRLPYLHAATAFLDMILGLVRLGIFFQPPSTVSESNVQKYTGQFVAAFVLDWISCIAATLVGLFTISVIVIILCKVFILCCCSKSKSEEPSSRSGSLRKLLRNKALRRFLIIDCNCPCYKARPKLRFQTRFIILLVFFLLRIVSIALYASASTPDNSGQSLAPSRCFFSSTLSY